MALELIKASQANENDAVAKTASTLHRLGIVHLRLGNADRARQSLDEALRIRRELAFKEPAKYRRDVAATLVQLGVLQMYQGDPEAAIKLLGEAWTVIGLTDPQLNRREQAATLSALSSAYGRQGRQHDARVAAEQALDLVRKLAEENPGLYEAQLAEALNNACNNTGAVQQCEQEAIAISRTLAEADPAQHLPELARVLNTFASFLMEHERLDAATTYYDEALRGYDQLILRNPACYQPRVAQTLFNMAILYSRRKDTQAADDMCRRLSRIYPELVGYGSGCAGPNNEQMIRVLQREGDRGKCTQ